MTSSDVDDVARLTNQFHPDQPGVIRPERVRQGWRAFVARNDEGGAVGFLLGRSSTAGWLTKARERLSFPTLHRTLARVGSRMRPIQVLYAAGGDADSVRELSVTATGRCSANDRSAPAATGAVIRPSSR
jgi:hypothetical protein